MDREEILVRALQAAGKELLSYDPSSVETSVKSTDGDIVTAADIASEKVITGLIGEAFPEDKLISEETASSHIALSPENLKGLSAWVIDPVDGTNNYKHGMAYSGISIGYIENGTPVLGGIYDPYRDLLYLAKKGGGATCNGKAIRISAVSELGLGTRVCTSNSTAPGGTLKNLSYYQKLGDVWVDVMGSAVLIAADIASGRMDLYFHNGLKPWDNAAAFLLVKEAGGKVTGLEGQEVNWLTNEVVMGNPGLVDLFISKTELNR